MIKKIPSTFEEVDIFEYQPSEDNIKVHPPTQKRTMVSVFDEIGFAGAILVNKRTKHILDGHMRVEIAKQNMERTLPAIVIDVDEEEEKKILLSFDTVGKGANFKKDKMLKLANQLQFNNEVFEKQFKELLNKYASDEVAKVVTKKTQFIILAFDNPLKYETACEKFGVGVKYIETTGSVAKTVIVDGDGLIDEI